jgi:hypothetical protein
LNCFAYLPECLALASNTALTLGAMPTAFGWAWENTRHFRNQQRLATIPIDSQRPCNRLSHSTRPAFQLPPLFPKSTPCQSNCHGWPNATHAHPKCGGHGTRRLRSLLPRASHESSHFARKHVEGFAEVPGTSVWRLEARQVTEDFLPAAWGQCLPVPHGLRVPEKCLLEPLGHGMLGAVSIARVKNDLHAHAITHRRT